MTSPLEMQHFRKRPGKNSNGPRYFSAKNTELQKQGDPR